MPNDVLTSALLQSMARGLSLIDLIRTAETMKGSGQGGAVEALYATWTQHNRDHPLFYAALFNYSVVLSDAGKLEPARQCLEQAIAINPDFIPAYINLGRVWERQGSVGPAVMQWSAALKRLESVNGASVSHKITTLNQVARTLEAAGQDEPAEEMLRQSLELDPRQREVLQHFLALRQRQCEWPVVVPQERTDAAAQIVGMSPLSLAAYSDDPMFQLAAAADYNARDVGTPQTAFTAWPRAQVAEGPLRVGYLSSDLREHAVGYLMSDVFGLHDRTRVEVFAYYCGIDAKDPMHERFKAEADHWVSVSGLGDDAAAQRMVDDGIQILVDLNGYTRDARLQLVARRPAPVIVNWLGYPGTMASPYHHYIVADDWIIPPEHERFYSERVARLPCYQPNVMNRKVGESTPTRGDVGLPENATVFCCFNGTHKITRAMFDRWLAILVAVPESVLWLLSGADATNERLRVYAEQRGVARDRLVFAGRLANPQHLARYPLADLFLDTAPYGAHTTASDALWMGVPVLTLDGRSFAARVCGSLVRAAGTPDLVCASVEDYIRTAIALGGDRTRLGDCRARLLAGRDSATLFDTPKLVQCLEDLYAGMWAAYRSGERPQPDLANLDVYLEEGSTVPREDVDVQAIADYDGWWHGILGRRHRLRPVEPDRRMATAAGLGEAGG